MISDVTASCVLQEIARFTSYEAHIAWLPNDCDERSSAATSDSHQLASSSHAQHAADGDSTNSHANISRNGNAASNGTPAASHGNPVALTDFPSGEPAFHLVQVFVMAAAC